jgi:hypothetical protein
MKCVNETMFSFIDTLNEFISTKPNTVTGKALLTRFLKVYLQSHRDKIKRANSKYSVATGGVF